MIEGDRGVVIFSRRDAEAQSSGMCDMIFLAETQRRREELNVKEDDVRQITGDIIDSAMRIHKMFGPGMLESVYERMLER